MGTGHCNLCFKWATWIHPLELLKHISTKWLHVIQLSYSSRIEKLEITRLIKPCFLWRKGPVFPFLLACSGGHTWVFFLDVWFHLYLHLQVHRSQCSPHMKTPVTGSGSTQSTLISSWLNLQSLCFRRKSRSQCWRVSIPLRDTVCYHLSKCPPKSHMLKAWSQTWGLLGCGDI